MKEFKKLLTILIAITCCYCNNALAEIEISFRFNDAGQKEMRAAIKEKLEA